MKIQCKLSTKCTDCDVIIQTNDIISHARMTKFQYEYQTAVERSLDYMRGQFRAIEQQYKEDLENVGK